MSTRFDLDSKQGRAGLLELEARAKAWAKIVRDFADSYGCSEDRAPELLMRAIAEPVKPPLVEIYPETIRRCAELTVKR